MSPPIISKELLEYLDEVFKAPVVAPGTEHDKLMYQAGHRRVVEHLKNLYDKQEAPE